MGNIYYQWKYSSLFKIFEGDFADSPINYLKVNIAAPALEELIFTVFLYGCYQRMQLEGDLAFCLSVSLCFSLAHIHMKWDLIKSNFKNKELNLKNKISKSVRDCIGLLIITFIFSLYSKAVFIKTKSFWPCFVIHSFCNLLGSPIMESKDVIKLHAIGLTSFSLLFAIW